MNIQIESGTTLRDVFRWYGKDQEFSIGAFDVLLDYYDDLDDDYPLDVLAVCREWREFPTLFRATLFYGVTDPEDLDCYLITNTDNVVVSHHRKGCTP